MWRDSILIHRAIWFLALDLHDADWIWKQEVLQLLFFIWLIVVFIFYIICALSRKCILYTVFTINYKNVFVGVLIKFTFNCNVCFVDVFTDLFECLFYCLVSFVVCLWCIGWWISYYCHIKIVCLFVLVTQFVNIAKIYRSITQFGRLANYKTRFNTPLEKWLSQVRIMTVVLHSFCG